MKLEKGKWYKWYQTNHNNTHIGKFDSISTENVVRMKPWIIQTTSYNVSGAFERQFMQDIVEITDLTEIQKLLPDVIAKPKFIVGKWYKNLNYGKNWIAKAISDSRMSGDNFYHGDYITDSKVFCEQSVSISNLRWNEDTVECPLSEIQQYLPEGHVDKVKSAIIGAETTKGVLLPKSERYTATMKFFEQLREPERSEAIENYNEGCSEIVPSNLNNALSSGFEWNKSKQGGKYWNNLHNSIIDNTYFKEPETETLVFGKYVAEFPSDGSCKTSDRRLQEYLKQSGRELSKGVYDICKTHACWNSTSYWRADTSSKPEFQFGQLEPFLLDIKPKDYNEAVHCTTQEEWDFVLSKFNPKGVATDLWSKYSDGSYIVTACLNSVYLGCFMSKDYFINNNYTILTFKQWCDKYNHCYVKEPISLEGRYIKCLKENDWNGGKTKVGQVLKIRKSDSEGDLFIGDHCLDKARLEKGEFELLPIDYSPDLIKEETMFKKGDYIVTLINDGDCGKVNYCSKQKCDETYLNPEFDTKGCTGNGNYTFTFSDKSQTKWRFGTKEEGEEYERHGKPYNVGSLLSSKIPDKPSEVDISYRVDKIGNFYIDDICVSNCTSITPKEVYPSISIPKPTTIILKTKSKSIKL